jgi:hypothetical protein
MLMEGDVAMEEETAFSMDLSVGVVLQKYMRNWAMPDALRRTGMTRVLSTGTESVSLLGDGSGDGTSCEGGDTTIK